MIIFGVVNGFGLPGQSVFVQCDDGTSVFAKMPWIGSVNPGYIVAITKRECDSQWYIISFYTNG